MKTNFNIEEIQYSVLYNQQTLSPEGELWRKRLEEYWVKSWSHLFKEIHSSSEVNLEEFRMQDKITFLHRGDEIIGIHLLKTYTKKDFNTHPYFKNYSPEFISELQKQEVLRLQSFQYFWIDPNWVKKKSGVNFAAILASLNLKFQKEDGLNATVTIARKDILVNKMAEGIGFYEVEPSLMMHNVPVAQMLCLKTQSFPDIEVMRLANFFWSRRNIIDENINITKKAA